MSQACVHRKFEGDQVECQCQESGFSYHDLILSYHQVEMGGEGGYGVGFQVNLVNFTLLIWNKADTAQKKDI